MGTATDVPTPAVPRQALLQPAVGAAAAEVYKDDNTRRQLQNYRACAMTLAEAYRRGGRHEELAALLRWARETETPGWESEYLTSEYYEREGRRDLAVGFLERASRRLAAQPGTDPGATYENALAVASLPLTRHRDPVRAEAAYRRAIAMAPTRYEGYHGLAATLQAAGRVPLALAVVAGHVAEHGDSVEAQGDLAVLRRALARPSGEDGS